MLIVKATMWPHGHKDGAYELFQATICNRSIPGEYADGDRYTAHVCVRPNSFMRVSGYEADVEIKGHRRSRGAVPLVLSVLNNARLDSPLPEGRLLQRVTIEDATSFERRLRELAT